MNLFKTAFFSFLLIGLNMNMQAQKKEKTPLAHIFEARSERNYWLVNAAVCGLISAFAYSEYKEFSNIEYPSVNPKMLLALAFATPIATINCLYAAYKAHTNIKPKE